MAVEGEVKGESGRERFEWNVENEIHLFEAMIGHKPVGIHKHFHMACICEKFETLLGKPISPDVIWDHLRCMYDLAALDKKETVPFPNEVEEFTLPVSDFSALMAEKLSKGDVAQEAAKEEKAVTKPVKEAHSGNGVSGGGGSSTGYSVMSSGVGGGGSKKERKTEQEESGSEVERKETEDVETDGKRGKVKKEEKTPGKRGKRSLKERKADDDAMQVSTTPSIKEDSSTPVTGRKRGKRMMGKRSLRSRQDDTPSSSKSSTPPPPPSKRGRRI